MKKIEEYIKLASTKENISVGGSEAYSFEEDGIVLVKYRNKNEYGIAREMEEAVARVVNNKNKKGVNTPRHIEILRTKDETYNYCWVVEECAKGKCFITYSSNSKSIDEILETQKELLNAPSHIYEKCILDLCELFNMGLELKAKNIFYDEREGFTFIDFLESNENGINIDNLSELLMLLKYLKAIYNIPTVPYYDESLEEEKAKSYELYNMMLLKIFVALEKVIPTFNKYKRNLLRNLDISTLTTFQNLGYNYGDLSLTEEEIVFFNKIIDDIINECITEIEMGKLEYWQVLSHEIRNKLLDYGLDKDWMYHKDNNLCETDFEDNYDYESESLRILKEYVLKLFKERLLEISKEKNNPQLDICAKEILNEQETTLKVKI